MKTLIHPELRELFATWKVADTDYNDMAGSNDCDEFADRARAAQSAFKNRRDELEAEGVQIWGEEK
jgi:hypothetical protein